MDYGLWTMDYGLDMKKGFTLIEVIISATIISLVAIGVYSVFSSGIDIWQRGNKLRSYERNIRKVFEKMTRELRNTFKFSNIDFEGTENSLAFAALVENNSDEKNPHYEVGRISYLLKEKKILCRREQLYPEIFQDENTIEPRELIPEISKLEFSYCYLNNATGEYRWKDDWVKGEQDSLPKALRIELVFKEGQPKFIKTVLIPLGTGRQRIELSQ